MPTVTLTALFAIVAVVAATAIKLSHGATRRRMLHQERMTALEKGVPPPEDVEAELERAGPVGSPGQNAALHGTIWTSVGLGMLVANRFVDRSGFTTDMLQILAFLAIWAWPALFAGVALLIFAFFTRTKPRENRP